MFKVLQLCYNVHLHVCNRALLTFVLFIIVIYYLCLMFYCKGDTILV